MDVLPDKTLKQIQKLSREGDALAETQEFPDALKKYWAAWDLLPEPRIEHEAATWLLTAIGDSNFRSGEIVEARDHLSNAMHCPGAIGNPFIHLRLGQCQLDLGDEKRAVDELTRAYMAEGEKIFEGENPKYLTFLKTKIDQPSAVTKAAQAPAAKAVTKAGGMNLIANIFQTTLGRKYIMGATGFALVGFIIGHLVGNLQFFLGPEWINSYGEFLKSWPKALWGARISLLACIALHIWAAFALAAENRKARPVGYVNKRATAASYASQTMIMSGLIVFAFIVYHLWHFTFMFKWVNAAGIDFHMLVDDRGRHDIYRMLIIGFQQPIVSIWYVVAISLLCWHLSHGLSAMFQSLGLKTLAWSGLLDNLAKYGACSIAVGYISIPVSVLTGLKTFIEKGAL